VISYLDGAIVAKTAQYMPPIMVGCITAGGQTRAKADHMFSWIVFKSHDCDVPGDYLKAETDGYVLWSTVQFYGCILNNCIQELYSYC
jgi:hypothetical protein